MAAMEQITANDYSEREQILRELAQDVARDVDTIQDILKRAGLTHEEYLQLAETRAFKQMLQTASAEWTDASNTPERIKLKAARAVEAAIPAVFGSIHDAKEPLSGRVEAFKTLAKIGGLGAAPLPEAAKNGQVFRLQINFPDPSKNIVIEHSTMALPTEVSAEDSFDVNDELL